MARTLENAYLHFVYHAARRAGWDPADEKDTSLAMRMTATETRVTPLLPVYHRAEGRHRPAPLPVLEATVRPRPAVGGMGSAAGSAVLQPTLAAGFLAQRLAQEMSPSPHPADPAARREADLAYRRALEHAVITLEPIESPDLEV